MIAALAWRNRLRGWLRQHAYSLFYSVGNLLRHPMASAMTVAVLGMALLLPLLLWLVLHNLEHLRHLEVTERISVFMQPGGAVTAAEVERQAAELANWPEVRRVEAISPEAGLRQLQSRGVFGEAIDLLEDNPLPWVLSVMPAGTDAATVRELMQRLGALPGVDMVQADLNWLRRLQGILRLADRFVQILTVLLAAAVLLVVSNTIRLDIQNREDEIDVLALAGATAAFIRRPFLYTGFWYGCLGGVLALGMLIAVVLLLTPPLADLSRAYALELRLRLPGAGIAAAVLCASGLLGLLGAWMAVSRRLDALRPR